MNTKQISRLLFSFLLLVAGASSRAMAQERDAEPVLVGVGGGRGIINNTVSPRLDEYDGIQEAFLSPRTFAGIELWMPRLISPSVGFSARIDWTHSSIEQVNLQAQAYNLAHSKRSVVASHSLPYAYDEHFKFIFDALRLDLRLLYRVGQFSIGGGASFEYQLVQSVERYDEFSVTSDTFPNPQGYPTEQNGRVLRVDDGSKIPPQRFGAGMLLLGVSYEIPLMKRFSLVPALQTRMDISSPVQNMGWSRAGVELGLTLFYNVTTDEIPPVTDRGDEHSPLAASIDFFALAPDGEHLDSARVMMKGEHRMQHVPVVPSIRFTEGSSAMPGHYVRLAREQARSFSLDSIARSAPGEIIDNTLNVIGARLRSNPGARITLVSAPASGEDPELARDRAEGIAAYLRDIWRVEESRIAIRTSTVSDGGADGPPAVTIESSVTALTEPLVAEWIEQTPTMTPVGIEPRIDAPDGIGRWSITISRGREVLARTSSTDGDMSPKLTLEAPLLAAAIRSSSAPLVAELEIEDGRGRVATVRDQLPIGRSMERGGASYSNLPKRAEYLLIPTAATNSEWTRAILESARERGRVTITTHRADTRAGALAESLRGELAANGIEVSMEQVKNGDPYGGVLVSIRKGDASRSSGRP